MYVYVCICMYARISKVFIIYVLSAVFSVHVSVVYPIVCVCMYIYIYMHTYIHTYIHAYIHFLQRTANAANRSGLLTELPFY